MNLSPIKAQITELLSNYRLSWMNAGQFKYVPVEIYIKVPPNEFIQPRLDSHTHAYGINLSLSNQKSCFYMSHSEKHSSVSDISEQLPLVSTACWDAAMQSV